MGSCHSDEFKIVQKRCCRTSIQENDVIDIINTQINLPDDSKFPWDYTSSCNGREYNLLEHAAWNKNFKIALALIKTGKFSIDNSLLNISLNSLISTNYSGDIHRTNLIAECMEDLDIFVAYIIKHIPPAAINSRKIDPRCDTQKGMHNYIANQHPHPECYYDRCKIFLHYYTLLLLGNLTRSLDAVNTQLPNSILYYSKYNIFTHHYHIKDKYDGYGYTTTINCSHYSNFTVAGLLIKEGKQAQLKELIMSQRMPPLTCELLLSDYEIDFNSSLRKEFFTEFFTPEELWQLWEYVIEYKNKFDMPSVKYPSNQLHLDYTKYIELLIENMFSILHEVLNFSAFTPQQVKDIQEKYLSVSILGNFSTQIINRLYHLCLPHPNLSPWLISFYRFGFTASPNRIIQIAKHNQLELFRIVIAENPFDYNSTSPANYVYIYGNTVLHWALINKNIPFAEDILQKSDKIEFKLANNKKETYLMLAAQLETSQIGLQIIKLEYDNINLRNADGMTAIMYACLHNLSELVDAMIETGKLDLTICNSKLETVYHIAAQHSQKEIVQKLYQIGKKADFETLDRNGKTPTYYLENRKDVSLTDIKN